MASQDYDSMDFEQMKVALATERARREQAEEATRQVEEATRQAEEAIKQAEKMIRRTNFFEFLDAAHVHLSLTLRVQTDKTMATEGDPSNSTGKYCPKLIRPWTDFAAQQDTIWSQLDELSNTITSARAFDSLPVFEAAGRKNLMNKIISEKALDFTPGRWLKIRFQRP